MELNWNFVCVLSLVLVGYLLIKKKYGYWIKRQVPFVHPKFPLGCLRGIGSRKHIAEFLEECYEDLRGKDVFGGIYFFLKPGIIITDFNLITTVFGKDNRYFQDMGSSSKDDPLSWRLYSMSGQRQRKVRIKLTPTHINLKLKEMFPRILSASKHFDVALEDLPYKDTVDVTDIFSKFTVDVIAACTFGTDYNSMKNSDIYRIAQEALQYNPKDMLRSWFLEIYPRLAAHLRVGINKTETTNYLRKLAKKSLRQKEKGKSRKGTDYLTFLNGLTSPKLKSRDLEFETMTSEDLITEACQFFLVTYETTLSIITFVLYELAEHQKIQEKARSEISKVLKDHDKLDYNSVQKLEYVHQIIQETLRRHPTISFIHKYLLYDYPVPESRHIMKKGLIAVIPTCVIHNNPEIYSNPEKFDPERFTEYEVKKRSSIAWLPFGEEHRYSLAYQLAMKIARIGIAGFVRKFKFALPPETTFQRIASVYAPNQPVPAVDGGLEMLILKI